MIKEDRIRLIIQSINRGCAMIRSISDFFKSLAVNMAFRFHYLFLVSICIVLHILFKTPLIAALAALGLWVLHSLIATLVISFVGHCNNVPRNQKGISLHSGRTAHFDEMYREEKKE